MKINPGLWIYVFFVWALGDAKLEFPLAMKTLISKRMVNYVTLKWPPSNVLEKVF